MNANTHRSHRAGSPAFVSRTFRLGLVAAVAALAAALAVSPATARVHIALASSSPAKDAHLMAAPTEIRLTFTGPVDVSKAGVQLIAADNRPVTLDSLRAVPDSSRVAVAKILGKLAGGTYTVRWRAVAADGAEGNGSFQFMYMARSED